MNCRYLSYICRHLYWKKSFKLEVNRESKYSTAATTSDETYVPRRALLYVPGDDVKKIKKATDLTVDCVVLDCEDGVAINKKNEARETIADILDREHFKGECGVRINSVGSGLMEDDLHTIFQAQKLPQTIVLPKVDTAEELLKFTDKLKAVTVRHKAANKINLMTQVESAWGLMNLKEVLMEGVQLSPTACLQGVIFGSDDFCADIGATRTKDARELMYARQKIITICKAFKLQAIDLVHIDFKDLEALYSQSLEGAQMGFTGKQVIHPTQVPVVQKAFSPSSERMKWAQSLIEAFDEHQLCGKGVFVFEKKMIDMPTVLQARNVLQMGKIIK